MIITEKHAVCLNKGLYMHNLIEDVGTGPQGPCHPRTYGAPPPTDEYTEYHENVLESYRHKQLNTQLQEYTEMPGEAI